MLRPRIEPTGVAIWVCGHLLYYWSPGLSNGSTSRYQFCHKLCNATTDGGLFCTLRHHRKP
jgi:hypothetical protein